MSKVKLPQINIDARPIDDAIDPDNQQINPSCILSYLGIRGVGRQTADEEFVERQFNAIPFLAYWDIYKNYYANKQEEIGAVIHGQDTGIVQDVDIIYYGTNSGFTEVKENGTGDPVSIPITTDKILKVYYTGTAPTPNTIVLETTQGDFLGAEIWYTWALKTDTQGDYAELSGQLSGNFGMLNNWRYATAADLAVTEPIVHTFPLSNIDDMRESILQAPTTVPYLVKVDTAPEPYMLVLAGGTNRKYATLTQEGLALKTYQSDLFNNWMETEWIDGTNGINEVTSIDTTSGSFGIDQLNIANKVYDMLNRIAISDGTYGSWVETVYTHRGITTKETPEYMGGLSKELVFQEVVSNSQATGEDGSQPLGTLAGKGVLGKKHKGGRVTVKADEPCYIIGIVSLTPRLDYSQGNKWDTNLKTMDDLHKPALDEIGFQDLITDQMAWWDTELTAPNTPLFKSAGKQPAWLNYMTNVNQVRGNFAIDGNQMFMTLNRKYEYDVLGLTIKDLTTYIDPKKFNHIFAQTSRDAQNYWTQIAVDITARRKMSAKLMPNL